MASLFVDQLRSNPNARVTLDSSTSPPNGSVLTAFIMQDFVFAGRNSFNSALEAILSAGGVNGGRLGRTAQAASRAFGHTISAGDSVSAWSASDRPRFSVPLLFLAINDGDNPMQAARQLLAYVYPGGSPNTVLEAPLGYASANLFSDAGCCSVSIGKWFATPRCLVVKQMELTVSQKTDYPGVPLYVGAAIEFEAYRSMTYTEVAAFFRDVV